LDYVAVWLEKGETMGLAVGSNQDTFNYKVISQFAIVTVLWGIVGMLVGVILAAQLIWPEITFNIPWLSYGRLRPLHTNAVIFAFGGSALFATSYYIVQRTCQVRLFCDKLAAFTFWGWQAVIVCCGNHFAIRNHHL
jgi:cytochrome c oxidase cbb3-type subunit 1